MKSPVVIATLLASATAIAATPSFEARVSAAKAAVATREGFIYDTAMVPAIHHAIVPCVPKSRDPGRGGEFVMVANVDGQGRLSDIDVRPASPLARCFARSFGLLRLQPAPGRANGWPIVVDMQTRR